MSTIKSRIEKLENKVQPKGFFDRYKAIILYPLQKGEDETEVKRKAVRSWEQEYGEKLNLDEVLFICAKTYS